jgi:nicotinate-nucleotide adenylyltransferase
MSRSAEDTARLEPKAEKLREKGGEIKVVSAEPFEVSSSQIRDMLKKNLDCTCYLDENVVQYIKDNNLYRGFEIDG